MLNTQSGNDMKHLVLTALAVVLTPVVAQADVIDAKINQVSAERDIVVASYAILSATGRLSASRLGLQVSEYRPEEHYQAVKDKWYGLRTPDGR